MDESLLQLLPVRIEYAVLYLTRCLALMTTSPFFGTAAPWSRYRLAFGVALTIVLLPGIHDPQWDGPALGLALVPYVAREFLMGALLGWIVAAAFGAVRLAGELITGEMGFNLSAILDPMSGTSAPVITSLYQTMAGLIFVSIGAHRWIVAGLARSFQTIPVGTFEFGNDATGGMLMIMSRFIESGVALAAPVMIAMFVITLLLGVISRAVPQLNILDTGYSVRIGAALGALVLLLPAFRIGAEGIFDLCQSALFEGVASLQK